LLFAAHFARLDSLLSEEVPYSFIKKYGFSSKDHFASLPNSRIRN